MNASPSMTPRWWRRPRNQYWMAAAVVVVVVAAILMSSRAPEPPSYRTVQAERGDVIAKVSATGSLSALVTVDVGSQVSGRIQSLHADFNTQVRKGQLIARIDPALYEAAVAQARANLLSAQASLERAVVQADEARRQATRAQQIFDQKLISENDRDAAVTGSRAADASVSQARAEVERTRSALAQAQTNLRYTDIIAPTDGIVISRAVNVGQTVAASLQAPVLFTIAQDLREMEVQANIAESDIGRLKPGMKASFTVDAYPGSPFEGSIREIRNAPQIVQSVVTYVAVIDVRNGDLRLKPGMTASVNIVTDERRGVLRVPNAALRFQPPAESSQGGGGARPRGGDGAAPGGAATAGTRRGGAGERERAVWVLRDARPVRVPVKTGLTDGAFTEITGGELREGEAIITAITGGDAEPSARMRGPRLL